MLGSNSEHSSCCCSEPTEVEPGGDEGDEVVESEEVQGRTDEDHRGPST